MSLGILFSLIALFGWGLADFYIQKTTRVVGIWNSLFFVGLCGLIFLSPFVLKEIPAIIFQPANLYLFLVLSMVSLAATLFDFEALKEGKIAIVEPIIGLELPITVGLSVAILAEKLSFLQAFLILLTFLGIIFAIAKEKNYLKYHRRIFEKGAIMAGVGAVGMALTNFLVGYASQEVSALATIWFILSILCIVSFIYLLATKQARTLINDLRQNSEIIFAQSFLNNAGWLAFAFATTYTSISIATTISESYIVLGVLLGFFINKEKLRLHQLAGIVVVIGSIIILSSISN